MNILPPAWPQDSAATGAAVEERPASPGAAAAAREAALALATGVPAAKPASPTSVPLRPAFEALDISGAGFLQAAKELPEPVVQILGGWALGQGGGAVRV